MEQRYVPYLHGIYLLRITLVYQEMMRSYTRNLQGQEYTRMLANCYMSQVRGSLAVAMAVPFLVL